MRHFQVLGLLVAIALALPSGVGIAKAAEVGTGSVTITEHARCTQFRFDSCNSYFFETRGTGLADFALDAARSGRDYNEQEFTDLQPGIYRITQTDNDGMPLTSIYCTSDQRRGLNVTYGSNYARVDLRDGEAAQCEFTNSAPTPTATPSPTATATLQPTSTPVPTATPSPVAPVQPTPFVVVIQQAPPVVPTAAPVATVAVVAPVVISPPRTGTGGLLPLYWDDEGSPAYDFGPIPSDNEWGW